LVLSWPPRLLFALRPIVPVLFIYSYDVRNVPPDPPINFRSGSPLVSLAYDLAAIFLSLYFSIIWISQAPVSRLFPFILPLSPPAFCHRMYTCANHPPCPLPSQFFKRGQFPHLTCTCSPRFFQLFVLMSGTFRARSRNLGRGWSLLFLATLPNLVIVDAFIFLAP